MRSQTHHTSEKIISIDDMRRNFGSIKKQLPYTTFILTDRGKRIGVLTATKETKRQMMVSTAGAFKKTALDSDVLWEDILKKNSRTKDIIL